MSVRRTSGSAILLWLAGPFLLWLSFYRPHTPSSGRAERLPRNVAGFHSRSENLTQRYKDLLGTDDAVWRRYLRGEEPPIWVTCVFHEANWKSLHPPHICLEGSNMTILEDGRTTLELRGRTVEVGRIVTATNGSHLRYVSLFVFVAPGMITASYLHFFLHHAPLALFRRSTRGFLLRVETYVGGTDDAAAVARCRELMRALLPAAQALLR